MLPLRNIHILVLFVSVLLLGACGRLSGKESNLSYAEASERIAQLAEPSVRIGLQNVHMAEVRSRQGSCDDAFGAPSNYVYPVVDYRFPAEVLGDNPDSFLDDVEELWRDNDLEVTPSESSRVTRRFGASADGFNFEAFVNLESGIASVGGSGPCVDPPEE